MCFLKLNFSSGKFLLKNFIFEEVFLPKTIEKPMKINENHEKSGEKSKINFNKKS